MSVVSNVILTARYVPRDAFAKIEALTQNRGPESPQHPIWFKNVNDAAGGGKCWEADTWMAAVNHLDFPFGEPTSWMVELVEILKDAAGVVLVLHHEYDEEVPHVWRLINGEWVDYEALVKQIAELGRLHRERDLLAPLREPMER